MQKILRGKPVVKESGWNRGEKVVSNNVQIQEV